MAVQKVYDNGYVSYENAKLYAPFLLLYAQRTIITTIQAVGAILYLCYGM